jgi:uncharacterized protein YbaA (DUF1428 family)
MHYVDGYVLAVPAANRAAYEALAQMSAPLFKEHGALRVVECWGDDVPDGKLTSFPMAVKLEPDEVVVFSWIVWPDKATRDSGMKAAMADPRMDMKNMPQPIPFDGKRMIFGGFQMILDM